MINHQAVNLKLLANLAKYYLTSCYYTGWSFTKISQELHEILRKHRICLVLNKMNLFVLPNFIFNWKCITECKHVITAAVSETRIWLELPPPSTREWLGDICNSGLPYVEIFYRPKRRNDFCLWLHISLFSRYWRLMFAWDII